MALNLARLLRLLATFHTLPLFYKTWQWKSTLDPVFQKLLRKKSPSREAQHKRLSSLGCESLLQPETGIIRTQTVKKRLYRLTFRLLSVVYSRNRYLLKSSRRFPNVLYQCSFNFILDQNEKKKTKFLSSTSPLPVQKEILFKTLYRKIVDTAFLRLNKIPKTIFFKQAHATLG